MLSVQSVPLRGYDLLQTMVTLLHSASRTSLTVQVGDIRSLTPYRWTLGSPLRNTNGLHSYCASNRHVQYQNLSSTFVQSAVPYGNHGCHGGNMHNSFLYVISNEGVDTSNSYPFAGKVGRHS